MNSFDPSVASDSIIEPTKGVKTLLGDPRKAIVTLSLPMIIAMSTQTLYNFVDAIWVAGLGADSLSAVGFFLPFSFMLIAIATGVGIGGSSALSRRIGGYDKAGADDVAAHTIVLMLLLAISLTIPFFVLSETIFSTMGAGHITPLATSYAHIMFGGTILIFFINISNALLRGEGNVKRVMYALIIGAGLNIVLDPIFIYTFDFGVTGAAWATLLSMAVSCIAFFYWLFFDPSTYVTISLRNFIFKREVFKEIIQVGFPATLAQLAMSFMLLTLVTVARRVGGTDGVAVLNAGWRVLMFSILPLLGIATAVTSVTGAAFGSRAFKKLDTAFLYSIKLGLIIEVIAATITYVFAPQIVRLFTYSENAAQLTEDLVTFMRIMCLYYPIVSFGMFTSAMFQGTGKGMASLVITILRTIILVAPLAYIFGVIFDMGLSGIWWGVVIGNIIGGLSSFTWGRFYVRGLLKIETKQ